MGSSKQSQRRRRGPTRPKQRPLLSGTLRVDARNSGTVETAEGVFFIASGQMYEAMNGDEVQIRRLRGSRGALPLGTVAHVLTRRHQSFVATYVEDGPLRVAVPLDDRLLHDFLVQPSDESVERLGVGHNDLVVARIQAYPTRRAPGVVTLERRLSDEESETVAVEAIIASHDLAVDFPVQAVAEAESLGLDVSSALDDPLRRDIRDRLVVTVDPVDARDFDDALSLEPHPEGGWILGVHIADVSHYVRWGSSLDQAARDRATSVYLVDRVLPMLPERVSCDLCSLRPDEDRLAMTVDLRLGVDGQVVGEDMYPSVIRSRRRFTYGEVDALLEEDALPSEGRADEFTRLFRDLDGLRSLREGIRRERGSIEFVSSEARVALDESGHAVGVTVRRPTRATGVVEEAMLMANEAVARRVEQAKVPGIYRVHEVPDHDSLVALVGPLTEIGCLDGPSKSGLMLGNPHAVQHILDVVHGKPEEELVSSLLLRAMKRATYEPQDIGHYGLGADAYCHFTSPIRRYPDLMMHRALKTVLYRNLKASHRKELEGVVPSICRHSSQMERVASAAAMESQAVKLAEYMGNFIGAIFDGTITSVHSFGMFVRLDETSAQGLLPTRCLGPGWWNFDEGRCELSSDDGEGRYRLGQRVRVRVSSTDPHRGTIDLALP